ncbi:hypothetical protein GCM10028803_25480 [Larkinella knui]|uniref:Glycosyl hydrolase family 13 catalytic domain-containing protein n=1 Tax=Larkinella knui TaxID=2025310 RepID=A0A3P1CWY7_9BACT|nr:hypothetical protein [Larkinella knui]RRB17600.1 hypothetical protein EHT87_04780 [Larkinella knui]
MPTLYHHFRDDWQQNRAAYLDAYQVGQQSFIPNLLPQQAVDFPVYQTLDILAKRFGFSSVQQALDPNQSVDSPVAGQKNGDWLKKSKMVGINVRTIGTFWNAVNYALTLPALHDSIHLLPIWEPGVVGSLYGMISWNINPEFFSHDLYQVLNQLDTPEKQLKVVVNLLHLMGRTVGMDVIPHTDRFSEMVLSEPELFEWVRREGPVLVDTSESVTEQVRHAIADWAGANRSLPDGAPLTPEALFGEVSDYGGRLNRRLSLIQQLVAGGFETVPMTMAPPYRGLYSKPDEFVVDEYGQTWYQYGFLKPGPMSRVFGPLARYKFYHTKTNDTTGELNFDQPNSSAWSYVSQRYFECQQRYAFDFMRGDMAHVQMRPEGVPAQIDAYYDPLRTIKRFIRGQGVGHFGFFAETFLAPPDTMGYGDELSHLEAIEAETTLGDLQSTVVNSAEFRARFRQYLDLAQTRRFAPNFTVMTADKDDPRFDGFYRAGNRIRYFIALFMNSLPSYVGLGFEVRNRHEERGANEEYSKLYVFSIQDDTEIDKVTHGPFQWGQNAEQFQAILQLRLLADQLGSEIMDQPVHWLIPPDPAGVQSAIAWTQRHRPAYVFVVNLDPAKPVRHVSLPLFTGEAGKLERVLDTTDEQAADCCMANGYHYPLPGLNPGACRVYKIV